MKRSTSPDPSSSSLKKLKMEQNPPQSDPKTPDLVPDLKSEVPDLKPESDLKVPDLTEDLIYEILRRADERTLGSAACVSTRWRRLAGDERLWEAVCVRHWAKICSSAAQLRHVVLTLGGFRKIYVTLILPLVRKSVGQSSRSGNTGSGNTGSGNTGSGNMGSGNTGSGNVGFGNGGSERRWRREEMEVSLMMMSIGMFGKMKGGK